MSNVEVDNEFYAFYLKMRKSKTIHHSILQLILRIEL